MENHYVRVSDVKNKSKLNRINYLFRSKQIKKYRDGEGYIVYDENEFSNVVKKKTGRKVSKN